MQPGTPTDRPPRKGPRRPQIMLSITCRFTEAIETAIRSHAERLADGTAGFQVWGGTKLVAEASIDL